MADATRTIRTKFDGDASDLIRATRAAQRAVNQFGKDSGKTFIQRFRAFLTGENDPSTAGSNFGKLFGSGIVRGLAVPGFGPALFAVLAGAVAVAAPALGAALASGVVLAFGAGLVGLGVVFAAQAERVETAFSDVFSGMATDMRAISRPLQTSLVEIAGFMQRTFESFKPVLAGVFKDLAPGIGVFADQFFAALEKFKPAVEAIGKAFGDLIAAIGPKLGPLFEDIADTISGIAESVSKNAETFASIITFFIDAADAAVEFVTVIANVGGAIDRFGTDLRKMGDESRETSQIIARFGPTLNEAKDAMGLGLDEADRLGFAIDRTGQKFDDAAGDVRNMTEALSAHHDQLLAATNPVFALTTALTGYEEAQKASNDAIKEFGVNSPEAEAAALTLAQATAGLVSAAIDGDLKFGAFEDQLQGFIDAGLISAETADILRDSIAGARGEAEDIQGTYKANIVAETAAALANLRNVQNVLAQIRSKTITITTRASIPAGLTARSIEYYDRRQHGGPVYAGKSYLVGEAGPELLTMPAGSSSGHVTPNQGGGGAWDDRALTRALSAAIDGATLIIDDRGRGQLVSRQADLYARAG